MSASVTSNARASYIDTLVDHNREWAERAHHDGNLTLLAQALPKVKALVIACADPRVDPAHVLGFANGDAVMMRNIGGRITPELIEQLRMLGSIAGTVGIAPGGGSEFNVVVLHHTDCGFTRLADEHDVVARYFGIEPTETAAKAVRQPREAVAVDVAALRRAGVLDDSWLVSGMVFDVESGLVDVVVAPSRNG